MYWGRLYALYRFVVRLHKKVLRRHTVQSRRYGLPAGRPRKSHGLACSGKSSLQCHGSRRFVLVLALLLAFSPGVAYAATGSLSYDDMAVVWGPNKVTPRAGSGVIANGVLVCANDVYNAALVTLGVSVLDSRLTHDVKAKLSNESTGGAFYEFAQLFQAYKQSDGYHYPPWGGLDNRMLDEYAYLLGDDWLYYGAYTDSQKASALEDLTAILDGGDVGGGGSGGGVVGGTLTLSDGHGAYYLPGDVANNPPSHNASEVDPTFSFGTMTDTNAEILNSIANDYEYQLFIMIKDANLNTACQCRFYYSQSPITYNVIKNGDRINVKVSCNGILFSRQVGNGSTFPNVIFNNNLTNQNVVSNGTTTISNYAAAWFHDGISNPVTPPTNWPETPEPTTPTAPVVPSPGNVQITISSRPTFTFTWAPQTTITTTTTTYDNSQELRSIYDELVAFHLDSVTAYNSMILKLNTACQGITSLGTDIDNQFSWLFDNLHAVIDGNFLALKQYLRELFDWLASQMDFTITGGGYNDATVVSWLKRIWSRLGSGINTRPNDPVANPGESVDWLGQFFETLLGGLGDVVSSLAADVLGLVDDVHDKFPFSIPWDALAALTALAAIPTTPHFTFDYVIAGAHVVYDIDLAPYNDLASVLRSAIIFFWSFCLLMKTTWLLDILGGATNMIGNFAVQALGG